MTDQAPELLRQFLSRDPRVVLTGNMLDAARDEIERLRALTRPPSVRPVALVEENNQLRAEIKTLKRKLATETDRADGFLLAAQALAGRTDHR